jgi:tRNA1(Val) A37 N6-methylase TrmN6
LNYSQPKFYKFTEDSILLADYVVNEIKEKKISPNKALDLCCGCGVIGLEIINKSNLDIPFTFCDIQEDYKEHFLENSEQVSNLSNRFITSSFLELSQTGLKFDLIVSNPPYFDSERSRPSADNKKDICQRFLDENFEDFIDSCVSLLNSNGKVYFLMRPDSQPDWEEIQGKWKGDIKFNVEKKFAGADLISMLHLNIK